MKTARPLDQRLVTILFRLVVGSEISIVEFLFPPLTVTFTIKGKIQISNMSLFVTLIKINKMKLLILDWI